MLRLHLSPFSPAPPVESCQALPRGSVIASMCSCSTELSVVSAWLSPVTFEFPQPPVVHTPRSTGMSAQMKSFAGVSLPLQPRVWYAQYLFQLQLTSVLSQSTRLSGRKTKYMVLSPSGQLFALIWLKTSWFRSPCVTGLAFVPACGNGVVSTIEVTKVDVSLGVPFLPGYCVVVFRIWVPPTSWKYRCIAASYAASPFASP